MRLLYPSDPFDRKQPDEDYHDEFAAARAAGLDCVLFSVDIVRDSGGRRRLIELGDGQVSDRKKWSASTFAGLLRLFEGRGIDSWSNRHV